ncbi:MAG: anti-sigma factor antagonist [Acidobacteriia bacterium]|nr:anti-sigma factor antagonist [Terriglobia bacterium]
MPLRLDARRVGKVTIVKCSGRIAAGQESDHLHRELTKLLPEQKHFVLHLGEVEFVDSSGLGMLVRLLASARSAHGDLKLCNVTKGIAHTLDITNLNQLLEAHASEVEAVSAFYQRGGVKDGALRPGKTVVCVDQSANVLAYVREVLRQAGYDPLTTANVSDARILVKAARPAVVILGPNVMVRGGEKSDALRQALHGIPTIELGSAFSTIDAGEAAQQVLAQVKAHTAGN